MFMKIFLPLEEDFISNDINVKERIDVAAAVIVKEIDKRLFVLVIQRARDDHWPMHWELPRGKCDKPVGENIDHCLKREVKEETGLDVTPVKFISTYKYLAMKGERESICHNYLCYMDDPNQKVKLSKEHDDFKWIGEVGEVQLLVNPDQRKIIEKILNTDRTISAPSNIDDVQEKANYGGDMEDKKSLKESVDSLLNDEDFFAMMESQVNEQGISIAGGALLAFYGSMLLKMAIDFYQKNLTKYARACAGLPDNEKEVCMVRAKKRAMQSELIFLKAGINKCNKAKDPSVCKQKIGAKIRSIEAEIKYLGDRLGRYGVSKGVQ
jgi:8-oxo-dGTP pyrophosphatase MutT (NUDIX family)